MLREGTFRIREAAEWLDKRYPGWAEKIDLGILDMGETECCIGGHLDVYWGDLRTRFEEETGFDGSGIFSGYDQEWREEIQRRIPIRIGSW